MAMETTGSSLVHSMRGELVDGMTAAYMHEEVALELHHPHRIESDVQAALADAHVWLTAGYSCALHCIYLMDKLKENGVEYDGN